MQVKFLWIQRIGKIYMSKIALDFDNSAVQFYFGQSGCFVHCTQTGTSGPYQ